MDYEKAAALAGGAPLVSKKRVDHFVPKKRGSDLMCRFKALAPGHPFDVVRQRLDIVVK